MTKTISGKSGKNMTPKEKKTTSGGVKKINDSTKSKVMVPLFISLLMIHVFLKWFDIAEAKINLLGIYGPVTTIA